VPQRESPRGQPPVARAAPRAHEPAETLQAVAAQLDLYSVDAEVDREVEDWNTLRKLRKRSFREPWRSFSIAAGIAFGATNWLLPDSVAEIADVVTLGLGAVSIFVGLRKPRS